MNIEEQMAFLNYMFSPRLYKEYGTGDMARMYEADDLEKLGDQMIYTFKIFWNIGYYTSPILLTYMFQQGYFNAGSLMSVLKITVGISTIGIISLCVRGVGRSRSPSYLKFVSALNQYKLQPTVENRKALTMFDFDFRHWPVDFEVAPGTKNNKDKQKLNRTQMNRFWRLSYPRELLAYIAIHTFGIRMIFPGCVKLLQKLLETTLIMGRSKLIERENAERYKLKTTDANEIDIVFIDNRSRSENGKTLVICSEGNAGFYEIGILTTPLSLKYSIIGWNHPGFAGSTGMPYPEQDENAIDTIIQFATQKLNFEVSSIILFGWSIGGYVTVWGGLQHPGIKGIVLDATFDDVLYLALGKVPNVFSNIVKSAIRNYVNLNILELVYAYNGPVSLIRRTEDEIICTEENDITTNRINFLLVNMLRHRFPNVFQTSQITHAYKLISKPFDLRGDEDNEQMCASLLTSYVSDFGRSYPLLIGEDWTEMQRNGFVDFLIRKHLRDVQASHCAPLPAEAFQVPWDLPANVTN